MAEITLVKGDTSALDRTWMSMPDGSPRQVAAHVPDGVRARLRPDSAADANRVNPRVEVGLNPESHPWTDAADSC